MPKRRFLLGVLIGAGSFAGTLLYRRRSARSRTRVDLYFDDGSMMSLGTGSPDADALLPIATELLAEAGGPGRLAPSWAAGSSSGPTSRATSSSARAGGAATTSTS